MRSTNKSVASQFINRWSSRAYDGTKLTQDQIDTLFEAARWSPSCFNEQPWKFYYGRTEQQKQEYFSLLVEGNQAWAKNAGFLCFIASKKTFVRNGKSNRNYAFDAGAAWMSMAIQAHAMGFSAHAMAGFDVEQAYGVLGVNKEEYEILAAVVVGKPTEEAVVKEERTQRKSIEEILG